MSKLLVFLYLSMATDPTASPIGVTTQLRKDVPGSQNSRCKGPGAGTRLVPISRLQGLCTCQKCCPGIQRVERLGAHSLAEQAWGRGSIWVTSCHRWPTEAAIIVKNWLQRQTSPEGKACVICVSLPPARDSGATGGAAWGKLHSWE